MNKSVFGKDYIETVMIMMVCYGFCLDTEIESVDRGGEYAKGAQVLPPRCGISHHLDSIRSSTGVPILFNKKGVLG